MTGAGHSLAGVWMAIMLVGPCASAAAQAQDCNAILVPNTTEKLDTYSKKLWFVLSIKSETESNSAHNLLVGANIIYEGVPIDGTAKWSDFQKLQLRISTDLNYTLDENQQHHLATSYIPDSARKAWLTCVEGLKQGDGAVLLSIENLSSNTVSVVLDYVAPRLEPGVIVLFKEMAGADSLINRIVRGICG